MSDMILTIVILFKSIVSTKMFNKAADKKPLKILKVCELSTDKENPFILRYKYDYSSNWLEMSLQELCHLELPLPIRTRPKGVTKAKKQDLISLCRSGLIQTEFIGFFQDLTEETLNNQENIAPKKVKPKKM